MQAWWSSAVEAPALACVRVCVCVNKDRNKCSDLGEGGGSVIWKMIRGKGMDDGAAPLSRRCVLPAPTINFVFFLVLVLLLPAEDVELGWGVRVGWGTRPGLRIDLKKKKKEREKTEL